MLDSKKVVLVVSESAEFICERLREKGHVPFPVCNLSNAWQTIEQIPGKLSSVDLIIQDSKVSSRYVQLDNALFSPGENGKLLCTLIFIRDLRGAGYEGPILANSSSSLEDDELMRVGATRTVYSIDAGNVWDAAQKILSGKA